MARKRPSIACLRKSPPSPRQIEPLGHRKIPTSLPLPKRQKRMPITILQKDRRPPRIAWSAGGGKSKQALKECVRNSNRPSRIIRPLVTQRSLPRIGCFSRKPPTSSWPSPTFFNNVRTGRPPSLPWTLPCCVASIGTNPNSGKPMANWLPSMSSAYLKSNTG